MRILLLDGSRGVYIPQKFAENYTYDKDEYVPFFKWQGIDEENRHILLSGPDHIEYWDAWEEVLCLAYFIDQYDVRHTLEQDGDLFAISSDHYIEDTSV